MTKPFETALTTQKGFYPNQGLIGNDRIEDSLIDGKNVWVEGPGRLRSWGGTTTLTANYGAAGVMQLIGNKIGTLGTGSAALYRGGAIFFVGSGPFNYGTDTSAVTVGTASTGLQVSLDGTSSQLAGLAAPAGAPTAVLLDGLNGDPGPTLSAKKEPLAGSYSFKYTAVRTNTNAESNGSPASNIVIADGAHKVRLTLFSGPFVAFGTIAYNIYVSKRGFPEGPWFFLQQVSSGTSSIDLEWLDGDESPDESPIDHDPPLAATHVFSLGSVLTLGGVLGGGGISASLPRKPEAFPPDFITFLNPNEPILGIRGRAADGWQYVFCRNSLHAVYLTGDDDQPIDVMAIWSEVGIANPNAASFVGGEFYCYSGKKGALRTTAGNQTAEPDGSFAIPVENYIEAFDPNSVVVGYTQDADAVFYFGVDSQGRQVALAYMRKFNVWSLPFVLADAGINGTVTTCVTYQGRLLFIAGGVLYEMKGSSASIPWTLTPTWRDGGADGWYKTGTGYRTAYDVGSGTLKSEVLINFDTGNVKSTVNTTGASLPGYAKWKKCNVKHMVTFTIRQSGTGANQYVYDAVMIGGVTSMRST